MMLSRVSLALAALLIGSLLGVEALARITLITLPVRERTTIQLDHPGVALVEEERIVPLLEGLNQIDFSWANTRIDHNSLVFRVVPTDTTGPDSVRVLSVSYPPGENALVWSVFADQSGAARVRISYILDGLDKDFHYRAIAEHDESTLDLAHYARIHNNANEAFEQAWIRPGFSAPFQKPLELAETKQVLLQRFHGVPIRKTYTVDPVEFGYLDRNQDKLNTPMHYVIENDVAHQLGQTALPYGKARIFQNDGKGGSAFVGEDWGKFTPIDDTMRLYLGLARDIVVRRRIGASERQPLNGNLFHHKVVVDYEIENFKDTPLSLRIAEQIRVLRDEIGLDSQLDPEWQILPATTLGEPDAEESDAERLLFRVELPAREQAGEAAKIYHSLHLLFRNQW